MTTPTAPRRRSTGPPHSAHALDAPAVVVAAADPPVWIFARGARVPAARPREAPVRSVVRVSPRRPRLHTPRRRRRHLRRRARRRRVAQVEATLTRGSSPGWCRRRRFESPRLLVRRRARLAAELAAREDGPVASVGEPRETLPATLWTLSPSRVGRPERGVGRGRRVRHGQAGGARGRLVASTPLSHGFFERTGGLALVVRAPELAAHGGSRSPLDGQSKSRHAVASARVDRRRDARRGSAPDSTRLTRGRRDGANDRDERARTTAHRARRQ